MVAGFAHLFNRAWSAKCPVTVVHYEQRPPALPPNFSLYDNGKDDGFSTGLIRFLNAIPDQHVILFLEDYWLVRVDTNQVALMIRLAEHNPDICKIDLTDDRLKVPHTKITIPYTNKPTLLSRPGDFLALDMVKSHLDAPYLMSLQAAIWRTDFLLRFLKKGENPWKMEKYGTTRVQKAYKNEDFDGRVMGCQVPPVVYVNACGGEGNKPGEYDWKKIPGWMVTELKAKGAL
jgi:hypothetical protein